jgi:hypothetical protein
MTFTLYLVFIFTHIPMTTKEIANRLAAKIRTHEDATIYEELFAADARNVEGMQMSPERPQITVGLEAMNAKGQQWYDTFEIISNEITDPLVNDNQFILQMTITTKNRHTGEVKTESEYILYTVENGKIVEERFFYM